MFRFLLWMYTSFYLKKIIPTTFNTFMTSTLHDFHSLRLHFTPYLSDFLFYDKNI